MDELWAWETFVWKRYDENTDMIDSDYVVDPETDIEYLLKIHKDLYNSIISETKGGIGNG